MTSLQNRSQSVVMIKYNWKGYELRCKDIDLELEGAGE